MSVIKSLNALLFADTSTGFIFGDVGCILGYGTGGALGVDDPYASSQDLTRLLGNNYPNPFSGTTLIKYRVRVTGHVRLTVIDPTGQELVKLVDDYTKEGEHQVTFDATGLPAGIYFYQLQVNGTVETKKMVISK